VHIPPIYPYQPHNDRGLPNVFPVSPKHWGYAHYFQNSGGYAKTVGDMLSIPKTSGAPGRTEYLQYIPRGCFILGDLPLLLGCPPELLRPLLDTQWVPWNRPAARLHQIVADMGVPPSPIVPALYRVHHPGRYRRACTLFNRLKTSRLVGIGGILVISRLGVKFRWCSK
jgi:hypothetical protein